MKYSQKGFTLVEALIAVGISTGSALVVYKVIEESKKGQAFVESRDETNQLHREIVGKFTDRGVCTSTLVTAVAENKPGTKLTDIKNEVSETVVKVPFNRGKIALTELLVRDISPQKNQATIVAKYEQNLGSRTTTTAKEFNVDLSFKDGLFEGCITRGNLGLDPKDACDLVVGSRADGSSYYFNGKCNFPQAACEQSGREWDTDKLKCKFSADDMKQFRMETCDALGFNFNEGSGKCEASEALVNAAKGFFEELQKQKQ